MVNTELIKKLLTRLKEDAEKGCELKSSDFSEGKHTLNVDAAHDAILYCQPHKHNDDTIFDESKVGYGSNKKNADYPGTSRQRSECVSKLEANVCYIRDSFSGVALKGYNNYLDSAGTPKIQEWHKYHFGIPITTSQVIGTGVDNNTKNADLLEKIKTHSKFLNYDKFIDCEYGLSGMCDISSGNHDIDFEACTLGLNFTWQAVLYYGYRQFLENEPNCGFAIKEKEKARKIIECLRQIYFVKLGASVPKWKIGHPNEDMFKYFNVLDDNTADEGDKAWNSMKKMPITGQDDDGEYYFITSQSFVHSQISKLLQTDEAKPGFEARNEGDEDSSGIGEVKMEEGMKELFKQMKTSPKPIDITDSDKIMLWQFLKFQGDSSHLVFYSIIKVATPAYNPISIKILTGERPLVKRAQLEGKTIMVKKFKVFVKNWAEACSSGGGYIEFVSDPVGQAKTLVAKAVSLKQSEYYADWGDNLDSEINQVDGIIKDEQVISGKDEIKSLKDKMDVFGKYVIEKKIQTYIGGDFKKDAEKFFKLMRPAKDGKFKPIRGAGGKQFDFGKDVDVVFSKLGFLADNYDTLNGETKKILTIKERMNWITVGRRTPVGWVDHLQCIVDSFKSHEEADAGMDVNYKVLVLEKEKGNLVIDIKGLTTFVSMNYYVMNDRSTFSSSSDSYQKVFFFAKILKFFIEQGGIELVYLSVGGAQIGGAEDWIERRVKFREGLIKHYKIYKEKKTGTVLPATASDLYKSVIHCYIKISEEIDKVDYNHSDSRRNGVPFNKVSNDTMLVKYTDIVKNIVTNGGKGVKLAIDNDEFRGWERSHTTKNQSRNLENQQYTYVQALDEKALFKKFLDTVPQDIKSSDLEKFYQKPAKTEAEMEAFIPDYDTEYPYTIWWLYSYINKGAAYEDFTDLFNSKITNNTKYYFKNEKKFMEWKEKILSHEYNASIRYKYDYFLNEEGGVFQACFSTDAVFETKSKAADAAKDAAAAAAAAAATAAADAAAKDAATASATAANTVNEFKIFTELEIKHLIVSIISLSGRFSDDNAILEDMEIVNVIQKELNKAGGGKDKNFAGNETHIAKDLDIEIGDTLTLDEVWTVEYETALKEGRVIDLTGDGPGEVLEPQKTVQRLTHDSETKEAIKSTLKGIIDKVFKNYADITELLNKVDK